MPGRWSALALEQMRCAAAGTPGAGLARFRQFIACLVLYLALEWLSDVHEVRGLAVTPWNPGLGFLFGIMVLCGARHALLPAIGYGLAELMFVGERLPMHQIALVAAAVGTGYGLAAFAARRWLPAGRDLDRLRDVVVLLAAGLSGAALVCLLVGAVLLAVGGWAMRDLAAPLLSLFVGDAIGIAIFAPIVLRLARRLKSGEDLAPPLDLMALALGIVLMLGLMHLWLGAAAMRYIFVLFAPIVLAAIRHGLDGACLSLAVAQFGLILILNATGQDALTFTEVQAEMLALTLTGLIVGVIVSERAALTKAAAEAALKLKALRIEADQAARVSLAGGMSSVLAHEINQPITAVRALARSAHHLIRKDGPDLDRAARNLDDMVAQIDHAAAIVRRMREFLRRGRPHVSTINVPDMLQNVASLVKGEAGDAGVDVRVVTGPDLPQLFGDRTQLEQVLLNLARNAIEAIAGARPAERRIEIGAARSTLADHLDFHVIDTGPGVPHDLAKDLFEPLRTSKRDGLGLGLAISAFIVQNHQGRLWLAASRPGHTEFRFTLPSHAGEA